MAVTTWPDAVVRRTGGWVVELARKHPADPDLRGDAQASADLLRQLGGAAP